MDLFPLLENLQLHKHHSEALWKIELNAAFILVNTGWNPFTWGVSIIYENTYCGQTAWISKLFIQKQACLLISSSSGTLCNPHIDSLEIKNPSLPWPLFLCFLLHTNTTHTHPTADSTICCNMELAHYLTSLQHHLLAVAEWPSLFHKWRSATQRWSDGPRGCIRMWQSRNWSRTSVPKLTVFLGAYLQQKTQQFYFELHFH